jgi:outer membrane protein assembly factor BamB
LYFGSEDGNLYALSLEGEELWRFRTEGGIFCPEPPCFEGKIYFGSYDCHLYAVDAKTGKEVWKFATSTLVKSTFPPFQEGFEIKVKKSFIEEGKKEEKYRVDIREEEFKSEYSVKSEYAIKSEYAGREEYG